MGTAIIGWCDHEGMFRRALTNGGGWAFPRTAGEREGLQKRPAGMVDRAKVSWGSLRDRVRLGRRCPPGKAGVDCFTSFAMTDCGGLGQVARAWLF
jgi:hypothetical protein